MTQRQQFIHLLFNTILTEKYVLLKFIEGSVANLDLHTDLDILIGKSHFKTILPLIQKEDSILKIKKETKASMVQLFIFFKDNSFLQIDFLFGFYRKEIQYLKPELVFEFAELTSENISICSDQYLLEHIFLFQFLNRAPLPQKYFQYFNALSQSEKQELINHLNNKYNTKFQKFDSLLVYSDNVQKQIRHALKKQKNNKGVRKIFNRFLYFKDLALSIKNKKGFTITFSGVDGAGKSTILEEVKNILEYKFRKNVIVLRHRPSILPILSAIKYGKSEAERLTTTSLPRQGKNKNKLSSLFRFSYYLTDYLLGQLFVKVKYHWRGYAVLYDRYYFDFIIDGKRSNIELPEKFIAFFYRFIYKAPLNLFLYADTATILNRKKELPEESIAELTSNYKSLFEKYSNQNNKTSRYLAIENIDKEKTLQTIMGQYVELL